MRALIQRVSQASVSIGSNKNAAIGVGLLIFVGFEESDGAQDISWLVSKIIHLRIFGDQNGIMNLSVKDIHGEIIIVSQFTLHASTKKGNRPSYIRAAKPESAILLYEAFISETERQLGRNVKTGIFGADMKVMLVNDGPVTIIMDSKNKE